MLEKLIQLLQPVASSYFLSISLFLKSQLMVFRWGTTFKMPSIFTKVADTNVAAKPMMEHNPLNPPIIDGFIPVKHQGHENNVVNMNFW